MVDKQYNISSGILLKQEETPTGQTENFGLNACLLSKVVLPIAAYKRTPRVRGGGRKSGTLSLSRRKILKSAIESVLHDAHKRHITHTAVCNVLAPSCSSSEMRMRDSGAIGVYYTIGVYYYRRDCIHVLFDCLTMSKANATGVTVQVLSTRRAVGGGGHVLSEVKNLSDAHTIDVFIMISPISALKQVQDKIDKSQQEKRRDRSRATQF